MESIFEYYNPNPTFNAAKHRHRRWNRGDCSVRAVCKALNINWHDAYRMLCDAGESMGEMPDTKLAVDIVLRNNGFKVVKLPRPQRGECRPRVGELADITYDSDDVIVCNCRGHIVCVRDGTVWDTWNSSDSAVFTYWILEQ